MTDKSTEEWSKATQKTNPFSDFLSGISGAFGKLLGKPNVSRKNEAPEEQFAEENSVTEDINKMKAGIGVAVSKTSEAIAPIASKAKEQAEKAKIQAEKADKKVLKKVIKIFVMVFFLLLVVFILVGFIKSRPGGGGIKPSAKISPSLTPSMNVTPTLAPYVPYKPSVYVDDPEVLQLELDISVLERQLNQDNFRETRLTPPSLDFNLKF